MENIISVKGLSKEFKIHYREKEGLFSAFKSLYKRKFKTIVAVNDISFDVKKSHIHGLIGSNGSGKSTIIKMLSGVLFPTNGEIEVMGMSPWKDRTSYVKNIGVLFGQKGQLNWELPALDTYYLQKQIYKIPEPNFKNNLDYYIDVFGIYDIVRKPVRNLSLGERMKCEFLCVLLHEPKLIFLDEPTIGLDVTSKDSVRETIKKINQEKGISFLLTTHDLEDVENLCNQVTIMNNGKIVFDDSFDKLCKYFSDKKAVHLKFYEAITKKDLEGFTMYLIDSHSAVMEIDTFDKDFGSEIKEIMAQLPVKDLDIRPLDIEAVVREIYQKDNQSKKLNGHKTNVML